MWKGVLRYDVTTSEIKVGYAALIIFFWYKLFFLLHGSRFNHHRSTYLFRYFMQVIFGRRQFIAQLNERLGMDYVPKLKSDKICGQGNFSEFQWTKHQEESLFYVASGEMAIPELIPSAAMPDGAVLIIINVRWRVYGLCLYMQF